MVEAVAEGWTEEGVVVVVVLVVMEVDGFTEVVDMALSVSTSMAC